mgnify:CR=1 FL=1
MKICQVNIITLLDLTLSSLVIRFNQTEEAV